MSTEEIKKWTIGGMLLSSTIFWLSSVEVYGFGFSPEIGTFFLFISMVLSFFLFKSHNLKIDKKWSILLIPFIISSFFIPYPYNIGPLLFCIGFLTLIFLFFAKYLSLGFIISGLILSIQSIGISFYHIIIPSRHEATIASYFLYPLLKLFGFTASFGNGTIFIQHNGAMFPFPTTWDTLGIYPFILLSLPFLTFLLLSSANRVLKKVFSFFVLSFLYLLIRYVVILHIFFSENLGIYALTKFAKLFFSPVWMLISFIPFLILIVLVYSLQGIKITFPNFKLDKRVKISFICLFIGIFLIVGTFIPFEMGDKKGGRVLVDEIHSTWEPSTLKMDKNWYGKDSTYNAYSMIEWLKVTYDVDRVVSTAYPEWEPSENITKVKPDVISGEITPDLLENYDILILKTPTMYSQREVGAIVDFVKKGGGLFVIGDHSNFCGTSTALNEITKHFGIEFQFDSTSNFKSGLSLYKRGRVAHPCVKYMPEFDFLTSCSINAPISIERIISGYGLMAEPGEYASSGFFRETRMDLPILATDRNWGILHQCVAAKYGKGRVVAFADSTTISNFRIFFGGSPNLIIGCMEYLNHTNRCTHLTEIFLLGAVIFILLSLFLIIDARLEKKMGVMIIAVSLMSAGVGLSIATLSPSLYDTIPAKYYDWENTVCFDGKHSSPIVNSDESKGEYTTFFIWIQRLGFVPTIEDSLQECVKKGKTVVIIDPVKEDFSQDEIELLKDHVKKGGNVLMMVNEAQVYGRDLIAEFGLDIKEIPKPPDTNATREDVNATKGDLIHPWGPSIDWEFSLQGEALKTVEERTVLSRVPYRKGYFVLCTVSNIFKDGYNGDPGYMGYDGTNPEALDEGRREKTLEVYNFEYELFEEILKLKK